METKRSKSFPCKMAALDLYEQFFAKGFAHKRGVTLPWDPFTVEFVDEFGPEQQLLVGCATDPNYTTYRHPNYGPGTPFPYAGTIWDAAHIYWRPQAFVIEPESFIDMKVHGRKYLPREWDYRGAGIWRELAKGKLGTVLGSKVTLGTVNAEEFVAGAFYMLPHIRIPKQFQGQWGDTDPAALLNIPVYLAMACGFLGYSYSTPVLGAWSAPPDLLDFEEIGIAHVCLETATSYTPTGGGRQIRRGAMFPLYKAIDRSPECFRGDRLTNRAYLRIDYIPWKLEPVGPDAPQNVYTGNALGRGAPVNYPAEL